MPITRDDIDAAEIKANGEPVPSYITIRRFKGAGGYPAAYGYYRERGVFCPFKGEPICVNPSEIEECQPLSAVRDEDETYAQVVADVAQMCWGDTFHKLEPDAQSGVIAAIDEHITLFCRALDIDKHVIIAMSPRYSASNT